MTWNIETVGTPGSPEYEAALSVLGRIDADVVGINEVYDSVDRSCFLSLAADAGYPHTAVAYSNPMGTIRNALMSRLPFAEGPFFHTSADLSGDPTANDITRLVIEAKVDVPDNAGDLTVVVEHWKSYYLDEDEFRRAVESYRVAQAIDDLDTDVDAFVVMGDVNEEIDEVPGYPNPFTSIPDDLPYSYSLGDDLQAVLAGPGLENDPFWYLQRSSGPGLVALDAFQLDGSDVTRPASSRRLDYIFASRAVDDLGPQTEVYDSSDEGLPGGLPKQGSALPSGTCALATDHLPVFADITVGVTTCTTDADCDDGVFCNGTEQCSAGTCQPGTPADCDDGIDCTQDGCDASTDACIHQPDHGACDNDLFCDGEETCDADEGCQPGTHPCPDTYCNEADDRCVDCLFDTDCDDGIACTVDDCDQGTCDHIPDDGACDNGLFCDGEETCHPDDGCQPGTDPCPDTYCDEANDRCATCQSDHDCDDGLFCNGSESCIAGACVAGNAPVCDDGIECTDDGCDEATDACSFQPDHGACQNGLFCDGTEVCDPDQGCLSGADPCPGLSCDEARDACVSCLSDADCDDGLFCNGSERCDAGSCKDGAAPDCDDGIDCTVDTCDGADHACTHQPDHGACDDGLFCNGDETCDPSSGCLAGTGPCGGSPCDEEHDRCASCLSDADCDDGAFCNGAETCDLQAGCLAGDDPCPGLVCDEAQDACTGCVADADCHDGLFCNGTERCDDGTCRPGNDPCPDLLCDEEHDQCSQCQSDHDCDDRDACNGRERCLQGHCRPGEAPDCDDGIACTTDGCNPVSGCGHQPDDTACDNRLFCDGAERCDLQAGCLPGTPIDCSTLDDTCNRGVCDEATGGCTTSPLPDGNPCDDGDPCSPDSVCYEGVCQGVADTCEESGCGCRPAGGKDEANLVWLIVVPGLWMIRRRHCQAETVHTTANTIT